MMKKRLGFTLAEVLIAMTIIGVISALMIPRVAGNATKKQLITRYKTTMALLDSAAKEYKVQEGGFDYTGDRTHRHGYKNIADVLKVQTDCRLIQAGSEGMYTVSGRAYIVSNAPSPGTGEPDPLALVTNEVNSNNANYTKPDAILNLPFGKSGADYLDDFEVMMEQVEPERGGNTPVFTGVDSFTVRLRNGAFIFIPKNMQGCNYRNVRWDHDNSKYLTPDIMASSNTTANTNLCLAYLDVNGPQGPNRIATCSDSGNNYLIYPGSHVICDMSYNNVTDVYPIFFYDDSVSPANNASNTVWLDALSDQ